MFSTIKNKKNVIPFHDLPPNDLISKIEVVKHKSTLNEDEAALYLNLSLNAIRSLRYKGRISYHKYGDRIQFEMKDLDAYKQKHRVQSLTARSVPAVS